MMHLHKCDKKECLLRGGIIGGLFFVIYLFILYYLPQFKRFPCINGEFNFFNCFGIKFFEAIGEPSHLIIKNISFLDNMSIAAQGILAIIILLIFYIGIRMLIGYLYWTIKIKERKKKK